MAFEQKDLDDLSYELKRFTEGMRNFSNKSKSESSGQTGPSDKTAKAFDVGTAKIVNALGTLSAQLTKNTRSEAQQTKYVEDFNKAVQKATSVQEKASEAAAKITAEKHARETEGQKRSDAALKRHNDVQEELRKKNLELTEAYKEATAEISLSSRGFSEAFTKSSPKMSKAVEIASAAFEVLAKSVTGYTSAIYNNERGAKVAAKALSDVGKPAMELVDTFANMTMALSFFMPGGAFAKVVTFIGGLALKLFGKAGEAALKYNELAAEQGDKLYKSFMELGKGGVNLAGGMTETFNTMQQFGMSVAEATEFTNMLAGSAKDLKYLGTTAGQGAKEFAKVAGTLYKSDVGRQLELMGVSAEEQRESALKFMSIQARTGQIQNKNTADLVKASAAFTKELDLAAELAGNTRKEQMEAREMAMSDERWRAAMDEATQSGDKDRVAELEKANAMAAQLRASGDEQGAAGVLQLAASRGALTTEAAIAAQMQYGAGDFIFDRSKGVGDIGTIMGGMSANAKRQNAAFNSINSMTGNIAGMQTTGVGARDLTARNDALRAAMEKEGFKGSIDDYLKTAQGKRIESDDKTKSQNNLLRTQQNTALMMDKFVNSFYDVSKINEAAANVFKSAVETFGGKKVEVAGGNLSTGGGSKPSATSSQGQPLQSETDVLMESAAGGSGGSASQPPPQPSASKSTRSARPTQDGGLLDQRLAGLNVKIGDVHRPGSKLDDRIPSLAQKIQSEVAGFERFTGFNDAHTRGKNSKHPEGKAVDFTLGYHPTREEGAEIVKQLKAIGFDYALDEYNSNSPHKTSPHIHAQLARTGGIFKGPSTGYNVELHGDEMVVPMNEGVSKQALNTSVFNQDTSMISDLMDMFRTIQDQNYQMIDLLSRQADNGDKLVQAAY